MISTRTDVHHRRNELDSEGRQYSKTAGLSCMFILMGINTNKPVGAYIFHRFYISLKINYHQYTASYTKRSELSILLSDAGDIKWVGDSL